MSPVATGIPAAGLAYDSHGNTTKLADQTLTYDVSDQHLSTLLSDGTKVTYLRDVTGRVIQRTQTGGSSPGTLWYAYAGPGDAPAVVSDGGNQPKMLLGLPGGG